MISAVATVQNLYDKAACNPAPAGIYPAAHTYLVTSAHNIADNPQVELN